MDIDRQSSMLTLLQTLQLEFGTAILYLSVDATSVQLMATRSLTLSLTLSPGERRCGGARAERPMTNTITLTLTPTLTL